MKDDYKGQHEAPTYDAEGTSAPMYDISQMVPDFYNRSHEYRQSHTEHEAAAMDIIHQFRGKKKGQIKVFRAIPTDVPAGSGKIKAGDWVTPVRGYAVEHGRSNLSNQFKIVSKTVPPRHLYTEGAWEEWGYDPTER